MKMTDKEILLQYCEIREEIKDIRRRKARLERALRRLDPVQRSGREQSETERGAKEAALQQLWELLEAKETELLEFTVRAEAFIESIEKSEVRIMFRLYYIDGLPWWKVAQHMNQMFPGRRIQFTEGSCWQRNKRFFDERQKC